MLGGIDPIIIFQFSKLSSTVGNLLSLIPLASRVPSLIEMPPIPIYLSENLTGIFVDTEDKTVDIETDVETRTDGEEAEVTQKGLSSTIAINLVANKNSIGLILLSSLVDYIFDKATSKEYSISYLHGPTTVFRAVLHSYQVSQSANMDLLSVKIEISKGAKSPAKIAKVETGPVVPGNVGTQPLG